MSVITNNQATNSILGCPEILFREISPNASVHPQAGSQGKGKKKPHSLPRYCSGLLNWSYAVSWKIPKNTLRAKTILGKTGLGTSLEFLYNVDPELKFNSWPFHCYLYFHTQACLLQMSRAVFLSLYVTNEGFFWGGGALPLKTQTN